MDGNIYEKRLGTDRMFPLVFRMALPAVAAQIANLLYGIVGHAAPSGCSSSCSHRKPHSIFPGNI